MFVGSLYFDYVGVERDILRQARFVITHLSGDFIEIE